MRYAALAAAFVLGFILRGRLDQAYRPLWRALAVVVSAPLALLSGWRFEAQVSAVVSLLVLLGAELLALAFAVTLARRGAVEPVVALGAVSNSGFWSIPISGALFGPSAIPYVAVYDVAGIVRPITVTTALRRMAPQEPRRATAAADYLPHMALIVGLLLNALSDPPPATESVLALLSVLVGVGGFFLLGAAMPAEAPGRHHLRAAASAIPMRFTLPVVALLALVLLGIQIPAAAWVIALSPSAFMTISLGRLYGYDQRITTTVPLLTVPIAVVLLPLVRMLGS